MTRIDPSRRLRARTRTGHPLPSFEAAWAIDRHIRGVDERMAGVLWAMKTFGPGARLTNDDIEARYAQLAASDPAHFPLQKPQGVRSRRKQLETDVTTPLVELCEDRKLNHEGTPVSAWQVTKEGWG